MILDPKIWGPHYWFVLHTIALKYPLHPTKAIKKKYYDFIHNLPLFIPIENMANHFSSILDLYPVTPYLDSRESFIKWMYFVHNKINISLNLPEKTLDESLKEYYDLYKPRPVICRKRLKIQAKLVYLAFFLCLLTMAIYLFVK
jgi:hypothetical protein